MVQGVPQESVLRHILFVFYIADLFLVVLSVNTKLYTIYEAITMTNSYKPDTFDSLSIFINHENLLLKFL